MLICLQSSSSSSSVQSVGDRIGGGGGTVALSVAPDDESGVRRDDLVAPCHISEGGEVDSENRIVVQPFMDDKNRAKNKDTSESEGGKNFSLLHTAPTLTGTQTQGTLLGNSNLSKIYLLGFKA